MRDIKRHKIYNDGINVERLRLMVDFLLRFNSFLYPPREFSGLFNLSRDKQELCRAV